MKYYLLKYVVNNKIYWTEVWRIDGNQHYFYDDSLHKWIHLNSRRKEPDLTATSISEKEAKRFLFLQSL